MNKLLLLTVAFLSFSFSLVAQDALVIVNGKETKTDVKSIDPAMIESISVLRDKAALDAYGKEGENGVFIIKTKNSTDSVITKSEPINLDKNRIIVIDGKVSDSFETIAPQDIQSISVIKGENAALLYGNKNASEVIMITTKKGAN